MTTPTRTTTASPGPALRTVSATVQSVTPQTPHAVHPITEAAALINEAFHAALAAHIERQREQARAALTARYNHD